MHIHHIFESMGKITRVILGSNYRGEDIIEKYILPRYDIYVHEWEKKIFYFSLPF